MATIKTLTTKQVIAGFAVGHMTVHNWRKGTASQTKLPCHVDDKGRVSFVPAEVKAWAKEHGRKFTMPAAPEEPTKPGPKPKAEAAPPAKKAAAKKAVADKVVTPVAKTLGARLAKTLTPPKVKKPSPLKGKKVAVAQPSA